MPTATMVVDLAWTSASGSPGVNVWHMRFDSTTTDPDNLSEIVRDFYLELQDLYPPEVNIQFLGDLSGVGDDTGDFYTATDWGLDGSGSSNFLPPSQCALASWRATTGGRSGRGRTFLGPLAEEALEANGTPTEAARTTIQTAMNNLLDASTGFSNGALGIWSRTDGVFRDFVTGSCPNYFAVLRSRRD